MSSSLFADGTTTRRAIAAADHTTTAAVPMTAVAAVNADPSRTFRPQDARCDVRLGFFPRSVAISGILPDNDGVPQRRPA